MSELTVGTEAERVVELERRAQLASAVLTPHGTNRRSAPWQQAISDAIDILQWGHSDDADPDNCLVAGA